MAKTNSEIVQKHLQENKKQLRVWIDKEKYEKFQNKVKNNGESIYGLINRFIDDYLGDN